MNGTGGGRARVGCGRLLRLWPEGRQTTKMYGNKDYQTCFFSLADHGGNYDERSALKMKLVNF